MALAALVAGGAGLTALFTGVLDRAENASVDARFEVRGAQKPSKDVVVVAVDDRTLLGLKSSWPLPRADQARFVDELRRYDPKLIAYDVQLTEASKDPEADEALYEAVSRARPVVLATTSVLPGGKTTIFGGDEVVRDAGAFPGNGFFPVASGGVIRRLPFSTLGLDSFAVVAARAAREGLKPERDAFRDGGAWIDFAGGNRTVPRYEWLDVLRGRVPRDALKDKIVVVGVTADTEQDIHPTSARGNDFMPGAELQANAIATVLGDVPLRGVPRWLEVALVLALALLAPLAMLRLRVTRTLALSLAALALYLVLTQLAFDSGEILPVAAPVLGLVVGAAGASTVEYVTEVRERRRLRGVFARFVPGPVVDAVVAQADEESGLAGVELEATVLFSDLRGFTTFAEHQSAATVIEVLNAYLSEMSDALLEAGGTIVAYMGDGIMAVFGAPVPDETHADRALAAARDMTGARLERFNAWLRERGLTEDGFRMGVGLNSGSVMSGTVGSAQRMEYTTVGDTTNVAARLEGMTKAIGTSILLSETTHDLLSDAGELRDVGEVEVRGRAAPMRVWSN